MKKIFCLLILLFLSCGIKNDVKNNTKVKSDNKNVTSNMKIDFSLYPFLMFFEEEKKIFVISRAEDQKITLNNLKELHSILGNDYSQMVVFVDIKVASQGFSLDGIDKFKNIEKIILGIKLNDHDIKQFSTLSPNTQILELWGNSNNIKDFSPIRSIKYLLIHDNLKDLTPLYSLIDSSVKWMEFGVNKDFVTHDEFLKFKAACSGKIEITGDPFIPGEY